MELPDLLIRTIIGILLVTGMQAIAGPATLPDNVRAYLDKSASGYTMPQGSFAPYLQEWFQESAKPEPWAISGDFDGDSISDWAGLLRNEEGKLDLVVVYAPSGIPMHSVLASLGTDSDGIYFGVESKPPGVIHGFPFDDAAVARQHLQRIGPEVVRPRVGFRAEPHRPGSLASARRMITPAPRVRVPSLRPPKPVVITG